MTGRAATPGMPPRLARRILRDAIRWIVMILGGVVLVYVSDKIISHLLFDVLEFRAGTGWLGTLIYLSLPDILFVALPASVTVAVYLTLLSRRESRELVVLAATGCGPAMLNRLALRIGLGAMVLSLAVSGFAEPLARYRFLGALHDLRFATLLAGYLPPGTTRTLGPITLHALPQDDPDTPGRLVIGQRIEGGGRTVITAEYPRIIDPAIGRPLVLLLNRAQVLVFPPGNDAIFPPVSEPAVRMVIDEMRFTDPRVRLEPYAARPTGRGTMTLPELAALARDEGDEQAAGMILRKVWQALVCLLAPFIGLLAMTMTRPATIYLTLPGACGAVLMAAFFGNQVAAPAALLGLVPALALIAVLVAALCAAIAAVVQRSEGGCIRPERILL